MRVDLAFPVPALYGFLMVLARVAGAFVFVPLPGVRTGPEAARVLLALAVSAAVFPLWPALPETGPGAGQLALWVTAEAAFGVTAGVAVALLTESLLLACQVIGLQAGYSYASTVDPATEADSNVLQVLAQLAGGLLFFSLGLDRQIVRVFAQSFHACPPGSYMPSLSSADAIVRLGAGMFSTGMRLALPVVAFLVLVDIALALLGRINANLQLLTLAFPVKMMAALALLATVSALFLPLYRSAAERTFHVLFRVLAGHGG
jgi:flagellar biosynthetic protein FliR